MLRPHLRDAIEEIEYEVRVHVFDGVAAADAEYARVVHEVIDETVAHFVNSLGEADPSSAELAVLYARLGAEAARRGFQPDRLQTALRLSSQVACRRFIKDAYRFSWPKETLASLTDHLFELLARAADAGAQGYARQQGRMADDRAHHRDRLRDLLVREPPPAADAVAAQAGAADWTVPRTVAAVALLPAPQGRTPSRVLPPDVLANWDPTAPYLLVPDPDSPGPERLNALLGPVGTAAVGPTVPTARAAVSLRWARHTLALVGRGILPADRPVRSAEHTALLAAARAEDLIDATSAAYLAPLLGLPAGRRLPLLATLLAYLECGGNAVTTGGRLHVHEQTVRYRLRRIAELTGHSFQDPAGRLDLMLTLTWLVHTAGARRTIAPRN
ncbi:PucR family transcriptional regulator [Streptomyces sp. NPDC059786]|uniref:PucR family transcriptional regulator n=1 Tax=Streptomyces sp. NPDC059786 TaxID=3346946 RepID=UPI003647CE4E